MIEAVLGAHRRETAVHAMAFGDPAEDCMQQALLAAKMNLHLTSPNPCVGAVVTDMNSRTLGWGATRPAGGPHAEIGALVNAEQAGHVTQGATLYVTLEPCAHHGRTGPCTEAIISAGITRVVAALADPNPLVAGKGFARLRAAGIEVSVGEGAFEAREQMLGFLSRMTRKRPWVRLKVAASLDGYTALADGSSQWITSAEARADGHAWRARACAVLTGIGTVLSDDPSLNVREFDTPRQPFRVVIDSQLQTPVSAKLLSQPAEGGPVWIYGADGAPQDRRAALESAGATVTLLAADTVRPGKLDLNAVMRDLASRGINDLHVEAGTKLNGSLLAAGLVDELIVYTAPKLLGAGMGIGSLPPPPSLAAAQQLTLQSAQPIGSDLRSIWRITDPQSFFPI